MKNVFCSTELRIPAAPCTSLIGFTASLTRNGEATANVPVTVETAGLKLSIPAGLRRGIWQLHVATPGCCCFSQRVWIDTCAPVQLAGTHTPTGFVNTPTTDCCA